MQSPTPRPDNLTQETAERSAKGGEGLDGDSRASRRDARGNAAAAASLKLLDRRAQAARESSVRREEASKPASPRAAGETRRSDTPTVSTASTRRKTTTLRRAQLALAGVGVVGLSLLAVPIVPHAVPAGVLALCLAASFYVTLGFTRPLTALADTSRAVALGDHGARAAGGDAGEFAEIARSLNGLLDERAATIAQTSERQQRLHNDIHQLTTVVAAAADGDLTPRASVQSGSLARLAEELNATLDGFSHLVHAVRVGSVSMNEVLAQAQDLAQHLAQGVARQGSGIESSASVLRHVAEGAASVTESAQVATDAARRTNETAQEGGRMLHRLLEGMVGVRRNAQGSATKMKRLGERAMEISTIVGAISRISAQTNMLALNAAIEASRAGEHGLGFTVVADEVRKLAEDCEEATKEIARLITAIQSETNEAVADLEKQATHVEQQTQIASDAGGALERILGVSEQSAKLVSEITEVAHQQAGDAAGLREAMQNAGQVTRDLHLAADRAQRTFEALQAAAAELARRVSPFRADGAAHEVTSG
jgi:methyl-accepting chemotaxis protein